MTETTQASVLYAPSISRLISQPGRTSAVQRLRSTSPSANSPSESSAEGWLAPEIVSQKMTSSISSMIGKPVSFPVRMRSSRWSRRLYFSCMLRTETAATRSACRTTAETIWSQSEARSKPSSAASTASSSASVMPRCVRSAARIESSPSIRRSASQRGGICGGQSARRIDTSFATAVSTASG